MESMTPIAVAIVENDLLVGAGIRSYLQSFPDFRVVGVAASGEEILAVVEEWQPTVVLMDLLMPGGIDGLETTKQLRAKVPGVRVIAVTASLDEARMAGVRRVGAMGYVQKTSRPDTLLAAIRAVAAGRVYFDPSVPPPLSMDTLTPAELAAVRLLPASDEKIADQLGLSVHTVRKHMANSRSKLEVSNRGELSKKAMQLGLIDIH